MTVALRAESLDWGYSIEQPLGLGLELSLAQTEAVAVVGANGSGKSTLIRTLSGQLMPLGGRVLAAAEDLADLSPVQRVRRVTTLPQRPIAEPEFSVRELVQLGRTPHLGRWGRMRSADHEAVEGALADCQLLDLSERTLGRISGGEAQRAHIARALAQESPVLLLDEPTTHLDLRRRHELFALLNRLRRVRSLALLLVLHDLTDAYRHADRVFVLDAGGAAEVAADDPRREERLAAAFGVPRSAIRCG